MEHHQVARRRLACVVLLCALFASPVGRRLNAAARGDDAEVQSSLDAFTRVFEVVERNYADAIDPDRTIYGLSNSNLGAIPGMLRTLDPHSSFLDRHSFQKLREEQEGRYYGVGMQIGQRPGKMGKPVTVVVSPLPGSPAFRAGLRPGDVIIAVNEKSTEDLNYIQVAELLKGPKGTMVRVTVSREGSERPLEFTIIRDEISHRSVQAAFLVQPGIGYIHISNFSENTNDELSDALKQLDVNNLRGMILDLRSNPGGLLQGAVDVADHFLAKNRLIVFHSGRHSREKRYYVAKGDKGNEYPMVVLINRLTASAAEILTAALQDHDRALVIGEPSFGKGLVQTVFALSEHTGLALTTAHYYTPSGRLIQRDYTDLSPYDYYSRFEAHAPPHTEVRRTDGGREVYGGGGITPDVFASEPQLTPLAQTLAQHNAFFNFGKHYLTLHETIPQDFTAGDDAVQEFRKFLAKENMTASDHEIQENLDFIKKGIRVQLVRVLYGETEAEKLAAESDFVVEKGIENLERARDLLANAKRYVASKSASR